MSGRKAPDYRALFLADLARSGLTDADAKRLKLRLLDPRTVSKMGERGDRAAYKIPYLDLRGKDTGFFRLRFLTGFDKTKKSNRYSQPGKSLPQLFFPPIPDLEKALQDPQELLYVTEGEKKAYRACRDGFTTLGLGGVWNWRSKRANTPSLGIKDLDLVEWKDRRVVVVFDSDVGINPGVQAAMRAFAREVLARGARPVSIRLPAGPGGAKMGFDDFLEAEGRKAFESLEPEPILGTLADELWRLNEEIALVLETGLVWRFETRSYLDAEKYRNLYGDRIVNLPTERSIQKISVAKEWMTWRQRRTVPRVVFEPAETPHFTSAGDINLWRGWGIQPVPGTIKPWDDLLDYFFGEDGESRSWFEDWCAYPLQHPGVKLYSAVVLFSLNQGLGKSMIGETLGKIYGKDTFVTLTQEQLSSSFNGWAAQKLFALGDEVTGSDKRRDADRFKSLVTQETVTINKKYQPEYVLRDCLNYFFTTNHPDAFSLEHDDRRFFVHQIHGRKLPRSFYDDYHRWLHGEGPAHLFYHLLKRKLNGFNPREAAPPTAAKELMRQLSKSDLETFAERLKKEPESVLRLDGQVVNHTLATLTELLSFADPGGNRRTTGIALSKALTRAGLRQTEQVRLTTGPTRLWVLKDQERWLKASHAELKAEREKGAVKLTALEGGRKF